ncbi:MAG: MFS transporter [Proteobacteria bacterium]|nr:MAG: MFS transporter [Pseudomonadota bacterium]
MKKYLQAMLNPRMLIIFLMGFSSGLPLILTGGTLKLWMRQDNVDLSTIGFFSAVALPSSLKFLWAPFLDRYVPPLGRRRGWIVIAQACLAASLFAISFVKPNEQRVLLAVLAFFISFFACTQDIGLDAFRREYLTDKEFGFGTSLFITSYRLAMLVAGAGALFLAAYFSWKTSYQIMALLVGVGFIATILAKEPEVEAQPPKTLAKAFTEPLKEYFSRDGALWIAGFILLYKLGDAVALQMTMPFYKDMGYSTEQIASVVKVAGIWATIAGGLVGGAIMIRIGINAALFLFGLLQGAAVLGFAWLTVAEHNVTNLALVVSAENFSIGMATAAYVAFMASMTNKRFSATQYALLTSLATIPSTIVSAPAGVLIEAVGYFNFFVICTVCAIPGLLMIPKLKKLALLHDEQEVALETSKATAPQT